MQQFNWLKVAMFPYRRLPSRDPGTVGKLCNQNPSRINNSKDKNIFLIPHSRMDGHTPKRLLSPCT